MLQTRSPHAHASRRVPPRAGEPTPVAGLHAGLAQSCVSSRVSGLQEASLLLQLLLRLWELLATWARGSERMRYLWAGEGRECRCCPGRGGQHARTPSMRHGALTREMTQAVSALCGDSTYTMSLGSSLVSGGGLMRT